MVEIGPVEATAPDGEKFVYIDCAVSNSKKASFKFRTTNITDVVRAFAP